MDLSRLKIGEIERYLQENPELTRELYNALMGDSRRGVRQLAEKMEARRLRQQRERDRLRKMLLLEEEYWCRGYRFVTGVDEAGRGPLAGPVVAAAVIFPPGIFLEGVDDSKKLTPKRRGELYFRIRELALAVGVGLAEPAEIDALNIHRAGLLAFSRAVAALSFQPDLVLADAYRVPGISCPQLPLVRGDTLSLSVAAASIMAKVTRDRIMDELDARYPGYGFRHHKGYPTREHREALVKCGPSPCHRHSFDLPGQVRWDP